MISSAEMLTSNALIEYQAFVDSCDESMIYNSVPYLDTLNEILDDSERVIVVVRREGRIAGSVCAFVKKTSTGTVLNALPYFGGHGDFLISKKDPEKEEVSERLLTGLAAIVDELNVGSVNVVSHPLTPHIGNIAAKLGLKAWDRRLGQISELPSSDDRETTMGHILAQCQQKTRNLVRKSLKQGFQIGVSRAARDWEDMAHWHRIGMEKIAGTAKARREFSAFRHRLEPEGHCKLYVAKKEGEFAGALLNLYYGKWVEYFTPVATEAYRGSQVVSALIFHAMCDAALEGFRLWNWGGTWPTQASVHHFKQGWGARSFPYDYFGLVRTERMRESTPGALRKEYPFYYVRPYGT